VLLLIYCLVPEPTDIVASTLTHVLYAFADISSNGSIVLTDLFADEQVTTASWHLRTAQDDERFAEKISR
jgi:GH18 family chitinase